MLEQVGNRIGRRRLHACGLIAIVHLALSAGTAAAFTITDFSVDPAHATLGNPHEVSVPNFNSFQLKINGTFNAGKCYEVKIFRSGNGTCGDSNNSNTVAATVTASLLTANITPSSGSFKAATDWKIEVKERNAGCTGSGTTQNFGNGSSQPYLRIRGCNNSCLLSSGSSLKVTASPDPAGCADQVQVCAQRDGGGTLGSGNLEYDWDLDGDGTCGVCSGGSNNGKKCGEPSDCPGGVCQGGGGFDDLTTNTGNAGCLPDQPCCVTITLTSTHTVGVKIRDKGTTVPCTACKSKVVTLDDDCDDKNPCNGEEVCQAGAGCGLGSPPPCDDGVACTVDTCSQGGDDDDDDGGGKLGCTHKPNNALCNDGNYCNGVETCHPTQGCKPGTPVNCSDGVSCTTDTCNEANDTCVHTPNNASCNDGQFCNGTETCHLTQGCKAGTPPNCNDGIGCTADACNESNDSCTHKPNNAACSNGQFCDGTETCHATQGCKPGTAPNCSDGFSCTADSCNENTDSCNHVANNALCSDGLFCNGSEICNLTQGCKPGTPPNCADSVSCTTDACNEANDTCTHTPNNAPCSDGLFCNGAEVCHAVNGCKPGTPPNCSDGISCTEDACNEAGDTCTHKPKNNLCDNGLFCDGSEVCNLTQGCKPGTAPNCADSVNCTIDSCDEDNNTCKHVPSNALCTDGQFCNGAEFCNATQGCKDAADPCTAPSKCDEPNDRCVACLTNAQCDNGQHCDGLETCNPTTGTCQAGTPPNCSDGVQCTVDTCNETTNSCDHTPDHGACSDGQHCDGNEVCHLTQGCQEGTPPNCSDGVLCTVDTCNEATDTCDHAANNAACTDGLFCNGAETCHLVNGCQAGAAPNCDDSVNCTVDSCDEDNNTCKHVVNHAVCNNNLYCDGVEVCHPVNGCQAGTPPNCDDGVGCTSNTCDEDNDVCTNPPNHASCSDDQFCNGLEICDPVNGCKPGAAVNCSDGVDCTVDTCDEATDSCVYTPSNTFCDDTLFCNGPETCHVTGGCQDGPDPNCDDGVGCTVDACDEATDSCSHTADNNSCDDVFFCNGDEFCHLVLGCQDGDDPCQHPLVCDEPTARCVNCTNDGQCNDGLFCNGVETCNVATGNCVPGTPPTCDDGVACTIDSCSPASDSCIHTPDNTLCANGLFCDGNEVCHVTAGCQDGPDPNCDDSVVCTIDGCDETNDVCTHTPDHASCSNGSFCDGAEVCHLTLGCQDGPDPNCDDGITCTADSCNEGTDSCDHIPNDALCSDNKFCTGIETCDPLAGCQPGTPPTCDDSVMCTADACDPTLDACTHTPNHGVCQNGLYCDGNEICHVTAGCQDGPDPNCSDNVACTVDQCNETLDICDHIPDNTPCSNGEFCDGMEVCDPVAGCVDGNDPDCSDGVACTIDTCNEATDTCDHTPDHAACQDNVFCNGAEICDPAGGCTAGTPPTCDDGVMCTVDACNATTDACEHIPDDALCNDNLYCTGVETCDPLAGCEAGTPVDCSDTIPCTIDYCDEDNDVCRHDPDHSVCLDATYCDGAEFCDPAIGCVEPGNPCAPPTKCDEPNDRCVLCLTDAQCVDTLFCNGVESCDEAAGVCVPGTPPTCDDGIPCTEDQCDPSLDACVHLPGTGCDDGLFCNGMETCDSLGGCIPGTAPNCDDGVMCTVDACDEDNDRCVNTPNNGLCDNGLFCDGAETCHPVDGCQPGTAPDCNDAVDCTIDSCNEDLNRCDHIPSDAFCNDLLYCNGEETCDPLNDCEAGTPPDCDDDVACTVDACNENTNSCDHTPSDSFCHDGAYCNGVETCDPIDDCEAGTPPDCDDDVPCTIDSCDEETDSCRHVPQDSTCSNGLFCDGMETCVGCVGSGPCSFPGGPYVPNYSCALCVSQGGTPGCAIGPAPNCNDGIACTADACDEVNDVCTHTPNNSLCNNTLYCDGEETCDPVVGCVSGPAPNCNDGVDCTVDSCNEDQNRCINAPNNSQCSDGAYCNGLEICDPINGCQAGTPPNCNDNVGCTVDTCNEATDSCVHTPDNALCDDDVFCNGVEVCLLPAGCAAGPPPDCGDGVACTVDACDALSNQCTNTPNDAACADSDPCTNPTCEEFGCRYENDKCGACCLMAGPCLPDVTQDFCLSMPSGGGVFQGVGSVCSGLDSDDDGIDDSCDVVATIPTVSQWGLVVLTLLLLTGAKVRFGRRVSLS